MVQRSDVRAKMQMGTRIACLYLRRRRLRSPVEGGPLRFETGSGKLKSCFFTHHMLRLINQTLGASGLYAVRVAQVLFSRNMVKHVRNASRMHAGRD